MGEDICNIMGITNAVNDIPAFGDLVALENRDKMMIIIGSSLYVLVLL